MSLFALIIYIVLLFIRPMEWWEPVLNWQLVTIAAVLTLLTSFPLILSGTKKLWRELPEIRAAFYLLMGVTVSWVYPLWLSGILMGFQEFGKIIFLYFLVVLLGRQPRSLRLLIWTVLSCALWMVAHGCLQHFTGTGFGGQPPMYRQTMGIEVKQIIAFGIFGDPNDLCLVFVMTIPLFYAMAKLSRNPLQQSLSWLSIAAVSYGAYLTNSRGGIVGLLGMVGAYAIARSKGFRRWAMITVGALFISVIAPSRFCDHSRSPRGNCPNTLPQSLVRASAC